MTRSRLAAVLLVRTGRWVDLDALAEEAAARADGRSCSPPRRIPGGLGSPLNPLAIF